MSTFNGQVLEFPDIRVDFFRHAPGARPPLACFLSHVHSDHLAGLESLKAPFVYCSAATREILLRLERFPHRVNFQLGILQSRVQHYRHLKNLLKPLPLETPTRIELSPGKEIQATLFDANHCTGSVMFLIEGDGKAILYTGDIRCEPWFVSGLRRNPILMEYTSGIKKLDCVYLDTTFTDDIHFPTKAEGLAELLKKIRKYPPDTTFHFTAWTFGYEEVWIALSKALKSLIHVDQYKLSLYESLCPNSSKSEPKTNPAYLAAEAPALIGHHYGNNYQKGCLTLDPTVRIHSCEKYMRCPALTRNTVYIQPILARGTNGVELLELGVGGGQGDLTQKVELEIDSNTFVQRISNFFKNASKEVIDDMKSELTKRLQSGRNTVSLEVMGIENHTDEMSLEDLIKAALSAVPRQSPQSPQMEPIRVADEELPRMITFPYSRHASYEELCDLVAAFQPSDVYPCTVHESKWFSGITMKTLFGQCCEEATGFRHDSEMQVRYGKPIAVATQTQHPLQTAVAMGEPVFNDFEIPIPQAAPFSHKRKAEDSLPGNDKRLREVSPDFSDGPIDLDASHMSVDMSVDAWETDDVDPHDLAFWMFNDDEQAGNVWDATDRVWRCRECGWEKWYRYRGCDCGGDFDVIVTQQQEMSRNGFRSMHTINGVLADIDLMDSRSNYDSVSDAVDDEYEVDSFISHSPTVAEESSDKDSDYEVDDEERYLASLSSRKMGDRHFVAENEGFAEFRPDIAESDCDSDHDEEFLILKDEDSNSEAAAEDPDCLCLWERMKKKADDALPRFIDVEVKFEEFRRALSGYMSEEDPFSSANKGDFDTDTDIPRSAPKKSDAENENFKRNWAKESKKFLKLFKELVATKKAFEELRQAVLGEGNDKYRDLTEKDHLVLMEDMGVEPHPHGISRQWGIFGDEECGLHWEQLFRKAHVRVHGIQYLLRVERKAFRDWRKSHKENYISYEDPYDSEYPTIIGDDDPEAQYLDENVKSVDSEASDWEEYFRPGIPSLVCEGRYRKLWNQGCRIFRALSRRLHARKQIFRKYRAQEMGPDEIDTYIESDLDVYGDKVLSTEDEPRPYGAGKLGRYGNDATGWDWKGLAEKARARVLKVRRLIELEEEAFSAWKTQRRIEYEPFVSNDDSTSWDDLYYGGDLEYWYDSDEDIEQPKGAGGVTAVVRELPVAMASARIHAKQSRVTDYFPEKENLPWHALTLKNDRHKMTNEHARIRKMSQARVTDYIPGSEHLRTVRDKQQNHRYWPVGCLKRGKCKVTVHLPVSDTPPSSLGVEQSTTFQAAMEKAVNAVQNGAWHQTGLLSVDNNHTKEEKEL